MYYEIDVEWKYDVKLIPTWLAQNSVNQGFFPESKVSFTNKLGIGQPALIFIWFFVTFI